LVSVLPFALFGIGFDTDITELINETARNSYAINEFTKG
jgi:hypothetical protein